MPVKLEDSGLKFITVSIVEIRFVNLKSRSSHLRMLRCIHYNIAAYRKSVQSVKTVGLVANNKNAGVDQGYS